jgi:hypothetical protein
VAPSQAPSNADILEVLQLGRDYIAAELSHRQDAYAGYPHKWSSEQEDLARVDAVIAAYGVGVSDSGTKEGKT